MASGEFLPHEFDDTFIRKFSRQSSIGQNSDCERKGAVCDPLMVVDQQLLGAQGGTEWWQTLLVLLASVIGVGVLSLPEAIATLGWIPGMVALSLSAYASWWSGQLYTRLVVAVPQAKVLADVVAAAYGSTGRTLAMWLGYTYIAGTGVVYHLTATASLQQMLKGVPYIECQPVSGFLFAVVAWVPLQAQSMHAVSLLSAIGAATIVLALAIVGVKLLREGIREDARTVAMTPFSPLHWAAAMTCCIFAFAGQEIYVELISKQRVFSSFKRAVSVSTVVAIVTYVLCASMGYVYIGDRIRGPITSALATDSWIRFMNLCVFVHVSITYVIEMNVLTDAMLRIGWPNAWPSKSEHEPSADHQLELASRGPWLVMSGALVFAAYLLETSIPFFSELVSLNGAVGAIQIMLTLPALCAPRLLAPPGFSKLDQLQCYIAIPFAMVLTACGATGAIIDISNALVDSSRPGPWTCAAPKS